METPKKEESKPQIEPAPKEATWYDPLIDIFKMLLQTSKFSYGTKKQF